MTSAKHLSRQQLEDAFQVFNQVSEQLTESYVQLQSRISELNLELSAARSERMRQLAEKERYAHRFAQLLDALPAAVVVLDDDERIQQFNPAASHLFDTIAVGDSWAEIFRRTISSNRQQDELTLFSGTLVNFTEQPLAPEPGRILLFLDITETRQLQTRAERQRRLGEMGQLAAQLAHQIRTPLTSALLYTSHLSRTDLSGAQREKFSRCSRRMLLQMEQQINDMLAFSRGGQYEPQPVDLSLLLREMLQTLDPITRELGIHLRESGAPAGPVMVTGNHSALLGAMMNIALNAKEHCAEGGTITIGLNASDDAWEVVICDDGPGVANDIKEKIFDPFFTTRNQGTGLGLAVSQAVALGHQGRVSVDTAPLGGARFCFSLPKATTHFSSPAAVAGVSRQANSGALIGSAA
jgi:two-component system sensor histidine kinase FlrB